MTSVAARLQHEASNIVLACSYSAATSKPMSVPGASHGVAHVFNSWADMPVVSEQMALPGSVTNPQLVGARFLLKPGRKYQEAVDLFSPYNRVQ